MDFYFYIFGIENLFFFKIIKLPKHNPTYERFL